MAEPGTDQGISGLHGAVVDPADADEGNSEGLCAESCVRSGRPVLGLSLLAAGLMIVQALLLRFGGPFPTAVTVAVAMLPVIGISVLFIGLWRFMSRLDEMQRRIQLEAVGLTVMISALICITVGQFQKIELLGESKLDDAWLIIALTYVVCTFVVKVRYR